VRPFRWILSAALALAAAYVLVTMAVRARARERWAAVLDHWQTRRAAFMAECFPEAPESEREQVYTLRVHPGGPLGFDEEELESGFPWLRERRRILLPFYERYGTGWSLGKLELEQVRRGFTAEIVVHADLAGPTEERDLERLEELFGEIGVPVVGE
jgi:hypothetical protein